MYQCSNDPQYTFVQSEIDLSTDRPPIPCPAKFTYRWTEILLVIWIRYCSNWHIGGLDDGCRYLQRLACQAMTTEWPDKPGPSRRHSRWAVNRSITSPRQFSKKTFDFNALWLLVFNACYCIGNNGQWLDKMSLKEI